MNTSKTAQLSTAAMTTGSVPSADGTTIGYLRVGQGPAVVILHGSNESARSHTQLALGLADDFTAFLRPAFDALAGTLPHNRQARFPGLDHGASGDPGPANRGGRPAALAPAIRSFFSQP